jgi:hypothetical protein
MRSSLAALLALTCACGNNSTPAVSVTPSPVNVLTCSTQQFAATVTGTSNLAVSWSVTPASAGTVSATGLFTSATSAPPATATIQAASVAAPSVTGSASVNLATAFPGAAATIPSSQFNFVGTYVRSHVVAASGNTVYSVWSGPSSMAPQLFLSSSQDGGNTWKAPVVAISANLDQGASFVPFDCGSVAIDAGNASVVYLYGFVDGPTTQGDAASTGGNNGHTGFFAVSTDGGATFTQSVLSNGWGNFCGDIVSPAANTVVIAGPCGTSGCAQQDFLVWSDTNRGAAFTSGRVIATNVDSYIAGGDTQGLANLDGNHGLSFAQPELFTNGTGEVCITYSAEPTGDNSGSAGSPYVQCSSDLAHTFSAPLNLHPTVSDNRETWETGAIGPNGTVAVAWASGDNAASGSFIALSSDGGKTFGAPASLPAYVFPGNSSGSPGPYLDLQFDSSGILWLTYRPYDGNGTTRVVVDKSCDGGKTWSGAVLVNGPEGSVVNMDNPALAMTTKAPHVVATTAAGYSYFSLWH